jgi:hypothetical protein
MAINLLEFAKLVSDPLQKGVVEEFPRNSAVLERLPFMDVASDTYRYNTEGTLPGVSFRSVNENYDESTGTINPGVEVLQIMGGVSDCDRSLVKTQGNINSIRSIHDGLKAKAASLFFTKNFFKGDVLTNPKGFDGLEKRLTGAQVINCGSSSGGDTLSLDKIDELIDAVAGGPDVLFMNKTMRRKVNALMRAAGSAIETVNDGFGRQINAYAGVPIGIIENDETDTAILGFDEACASGNSVGTSIYACRFGEMEYLSGIQCGPMDVIDMGLYAGGIKYRTLIEWIVSIAIFNGRSCARLRYIKNA